MRTTHACSSTRYFGYCEQERHGVIYRRITAVGILFNVGFADGATKEFGPKCLKISLMSRILNG
jgi:hypothetical protein